MTELNKKRVGIIFEVIGFIFVSSLMVLCGYLYNANEELKSIVNEQNEYLKLNVASDSTRKVKSNNLQDSLNSYNNTINEAFGKGNIDPNLFLDSYKKLEAQRDSLKSIYNYAKMVYQFDIIYNLSVVNNKGEFITTSSLNFKQNTPADSARMLLPTFRKHLFYDKKRKVWIISSFAE